VSAYGDIIVAFKHVLESNIDGLKVYTYPPDAMNQFPAAVILPSDVDPRIALQGNCFTTTIRVTFLVAGALTEEAFATIYDMIDPVDHRSVIQAIRNDRELNGAVDDADVTSVERVGVRTIGAGFFAGFDILVDVVKSLA
jgi:hypothetical protein